MVHALIAVQRVGSLKMRIRRSPILGLSVSDAIAAHPDTGEVVSGDQVASHVDQPLNG